MSNVKLKDSPGLKGVLSVRATDVRTGKQVRNYTIRNVITHDAVNALLKLLLDIGTSSDNALAEIWAGENGDPPTRSDTSGTIIVAEISGGSGEGKLTLSGGTPNYGNGSLTVDAVFPSGIAYTGDLYEAGLMTGDGELFARQIHPVIGKNTNIQVDYTWTISFTA